MQPLAPLFVTLDPSDDVNADNGETRRNIVVRGLNNLKGWQAIPAAVIVLYCFLGIFGPTLAPFEPYKGTIANRLCPPLAIDALTTAQHPASRATDCSAANILGTDQIGRDIFSRLLHGAWTSLWVVGFSVVIGTVIGSVAGAVINGWSWKRRLIAYLITSVTVVPFAVFVFTEPHTLYFYGVINSVQLTSHAAEWSAVAALSSFSAVLAFAIIAVAYRYDGACRHSWFAEIDTEYPAQSFCRQLHTHLIALAPWIGLAAIANAALVFFRSGSGVYQSSAITWSLEREYLFEHIGMFSPLVPMVFVPIAFMALGVWWFLHHIQGRFITTSIVSVHSVDGGADELSTDISVPTEEGSDHLEPQSSENDGNDVLTECGSILKRRRWMVAMIVIVAAVVAIRFGVTELVPIVRELAQDSAGGYQSAWSQSLKGRIEASDCANELNSRLKTLGALELDELGIEASQRCLNLYFQHRNAPSHRLTVDFALRFVTQILTLAFIASIVSAVLWTFASASPRAVRRTVEICVILIALIGLTITFGDYGWYLVVSRWVDPAALPIDNKGMAISRVIYIIRDFSVALGISYLTIAIAKPTIRFGKAVPKFDVLSSWASFFVPCVMLTSGLLIVFHYHFPSIFLFLDEQLGVIVNPSHEYYISSRSLVRYWLWTYWFALIGYAAIVFGVFAAAIWGFRRYVRSDVNGIDSTPVSPDNPSPDAGPT